jgi:hypothetical protein
MWRTACRTILALILFLVCLGAGAANFSFTGNFDRDDDVQLFRFAVEGSSLNLVTLLTLSYAGGLNSTGVVVPPSGFDPVIALFDGAGALIAESDDGSNAVDPATGLSLDAFLEIGIPAGGYFIALTQSPNFALGPSLADGFELAGISDFAGGFVDAFGNQRDGDWALDILNVASAAAVAAVPVPGTLWLLAVSLPGLALWRRTTSKQRRLRH